MKEPELVRTEHKIPVIVETVDFFVGEEIAGAGVTYAKLKLSLWSQVIKYHSPLDVLHFYP